MADFSLEELKCLMFCVASYVDNKGDTVYPELVEKLRHLSKAAQMTQKEIDYYNLLEKTNGRA